MQDGAGWVWWMWLQTHSCITKNLYFLNGVRLGDTANHFQNSISQQLPMATLGFQSSHPHFSTIQSSQTPTSSYLTSTLSFTSSSPSSWQTIFVILHFFFFTFLSLLLYSQSCRTQFKCFLNLCLPGCSPTTPKEMPPYFNHASILGILG